MFTALALAVRAQEASTNALKTEIENFAAQTNTVIVKAFSPAGSVLVGSGTVSIRCKETSDIGHGLKEYGIAVELTAEPRFRQIAIVDEAELDSLADSLNYLAKINSGVTTKSAFTAGYTTKSGLRLAAHGSQRQSGIQYYHSSERRPKTPMDTSQLGQFSSLVSQARNTINALKQPR